MAVLSILIDRAGEIVTREELQDELWRGGTNVDFENGLNAAVNRLRQTLGESADVPRYVETIAGRGYRFIAPIERQSAHPLLEMAPVGEQRTERGPSSDRPWAILAAVTLLVGAGAYAGYRFGRDSGSSALQAQMRPIRYTVLPPPGFEMNPASSRQTFALSPDGTQLAFSAMGADGGFELFLRDFDSLETKPVPDTEGVYHLFWTADSRSLIISAKGKLRRLSMPMGGAQQIIGDFPTMTFSGTFLDPQRLLIGGRLQSGILSTPGGGFETTKESYRWPHLLPDGRHVLDINFDSQGRHRARVMLPGSTAPIRELMETDSRVEYAPSSTVPGMGYLLYVRAGNLMAQRFDPSTLSMAGSPVPIARKVYTFLPSGAAEFSVSKNGTLAYQSIAGRSQLMWVDRQGRELSAVSPPNLLLRSARVSPDQRTVATAVYDVEKGATSIWLFDVAKGAGRMVSGAPGTEDSPVWSPDSRKFVFHRAQVALPSLFMRHVSEEGREDALSSGGFHAATDWSSD
ncbi:MAG TPA: winged helix-turn-helix domain-containing protein, partial [Bryobacteraceae bacterium]|nr:winged helix-turn-helix domain-containing protein [Bryobacteraceae bacterium]